MGSRGALPLLLLVLASACNAVLGLDELPLASNGGAGGTDANQGGTGATSGASGGADSGSSSGTGTTGGAAGSSAQAGSGSSNGGSAGSGGSGGSAGSSSGNGGALGGGGSNPGGNAGAGGADDGGNGGAGGASEPSCPAPLEVTALGNSFALSRSCWHTSASDCYVFDSRPDRTLDGDLETRFTTGAYMDPGSAFEYLIDLRSAVSLRRAVLKSADGDYARNLEIHVSTDNKRWTPVACGAGSTITDFSFEARTARYVKLVQGGTGPGWWSLHEVVLFGSEQDSCVGYLGTPPVGACGRLNTPP